MNLCIAGVTSLECKHHKKLIDLIDYSITLTLETVPGTQWEPSIWWMDQEEWVGGLLNKWNQVGETGAAELEEVPELSPGMRTWPKGHGKPQWLLNRWVTCHRVTKLAGRVMHQLRHLRTSFWPPEWLILTTDPIHITDENGPQPHPRVEVSPQPVNHFFKYLTHFNFLRYSYWLNFKELKLLYYYHTVPGLPVPRHLNKSWSDTLGSSGRLVHGPFLWMKVIHPVVN